VVLKRPGNLDSEITQGYYLSKPIPFDQVVGFSMDHVETDWSIDNRVLRLIKRFFAGI
jgi:hypothetical protein